VNPPGAPVTGDLTSLLLLLGAGVFLAGLLAIVLVVVTRRRNAAPAPQPQRFLSIDPRPAPGQPTMLDLVETLVEQGTKRRQREKLEAALYETYGPGAPGPKA
jgi:hypothetical protein